MTTETSTPTAVTLSVTDVPVVGSVQCAFNRYSFTGSQFRSVFFAQLTLLSLIGV
jgi:hypothetical protein